MKVTNLDIETICNSINRLNIIIVRNPTPSVVSKAIDDRSRLYGLKKRLVDEFTKREFPCSNKVT
ncbi:unnamed protein product [marine sediment metagenome]|uniref:Uncharacterized protein n=1 Tax=marine sediment metagenome TaxID=412755 RepID=X1HNW8_9ZZZZ